jgi:flagellar basal-body rod modification protein FlgD
MASSIFTPSQISSLTASTGSSTSSSASAAATNALSAQGLAGNFNEFLTLLTTQLQNQDPLSPLDTNQFTQQLVEFSGVEQQINMNQQLTTLIGLQQTAQSAQAASFVGATVVVNGSTAQLANSQAAWNYSVGSPATATFTVTNASGQTVFSQTGTVQPGQQTFNWNGVGTNGQQWPDGSYTLSVTATDASGKSVAVSTQVQGVVQSVDLTQNPPVLSVGGQNFTLNQIQGVVAPASATADASALAQLANLLKGNNSGSGS